MFAINHAAAALIVKRRFPDVSLIPILVGAQLMELLWVALNFLGIERTTTEATVRYVGDIHLVYMPFSHSIATMVAVGLAAWLAGTLVGRSRWGLAIGIAIVSHLLLDLITHDRDIALAPLMTGAEYGTRLYNTLPVAAFVLELGFGLLCWRIYRGGRALLAIIVVFNVANASLFSSFIPGPEQLFANRPMVLTGVILFQIVITLWAVWWGAKRSPQPPAPTAEGETIPAVLVPAP
jgi:hypothetical protein